VFLAVPTLVLLLLRVDASGTIVSATLGLAFVSYLLAILGFFAALVASVQASRAAGAQPAAAVALVVNGAMAVSWTLFWIWALPGLAR
jgi:hypothetical protein